MSTLLLGNLFGMLSFADHKHPEDPKTSLQLIMFDEDGCSWCEKWNEEIGDVYPITNEGKIAPLVRINIHDRDYPPYDRLEGLYFTPTFVVMEDDQEIGRIRGYPSEDFFWPLLNEILDKRKVAASQ